MATLMINKIKSNETISIPLTTTEPAGACMAFTDGETTYYAQLVLKGYPFDSGIYTVRKLNGSRNNSDWFALSTRLFNAINFDYYRHSGFSSGSLSYAKLLKPTIAQMNNVSYMRCNFDGNNPGYIFSFGELDGNAVTGEKEVFFLSTYIYPPAIVEYTDYYVVIVSWEDYTSTSKYIRVRKNKKDYIELVVNGSVVCTSTAPITGAKQALEVAAYNNECYIKLGSQKTATFTKKFSSGAYSLYVGGGELAMNPCVAFSRCYFEQSLELKHYSKNTLKSQYRFMWRYT